MSGSNISTSSTPTCCALSSSQLAASIATWWSPRQGWGYPSDPPIARLARCAGRPRTGRRNHAGPESVTRQMGTVEQPVETIADRGDRLPPIPHIAALRALYDNGATVLDVIERV